MGRGGQIMETAVELIHGYRALEELGRGNFGVVWKGEDVRTNKKVAIKVVNLTAGAGLSEVQSLELVKHFNHPHVLQVYTAALRTQDGREHALDFAANPDARKLGLRELVLVMELGSETLDDRLERANQGRAATDRRGLPADELLKFVADAAKGLDFLNAKDHGLDLGDGLADRRIIHCDIKPANLLVVKAGRDEIVKVADCGIAVTEDVRKSRVGFTPAYAPPELLAKKPHKNSDQYSLAVTYYELRTGRLPFDEGSSANNMLWTIGFGELTLDDPAVTPAERAVLRKATCKQPDGRYGSCHELVRALRAAVPRSHPSLNSLDGMTSVADIVRPPTVVPDDGHGADLSITRRSEIEISPPPTSSGVISFPILPGSGPEIPADPNDPTAGLHSPGVLDDELLKEIASGRQPTPTPRTPTPIKDLFETRVPGQTDIEPIAVPPPPRKPVLPAGKSTPPKPKTAPPPDRGPGTVVPRPTAPKGDTHPPPLVVPPPPWQQPATPAGGFRVRPLVAAGLAAGVAAVGVGVWGISGGGSNPATMGPETAAVEPNPDKVRGSMHPSGSDSSGTKSGTDTTDGTSKPGTAGGGNDTQVAKADITSKDLPAVPKPGLMPAQPDPEAVAFKKVREDVVALLRDPKWEAGRIEKLAVALKLPWKADPTRRKQLVVLVVENCPSDQRDGIESLIRTEVRSADPSAWEAVKDTLKGWRAAALDSQRDRMLTALSPLAVETVSDRDRETAKNAVLQYDKAREQAGDDYSPSTPLGTPVPLATAWANDNWGLVATTFASASADAVSAAVGMEYVRHLTDRPTDVPGVVRDLRKLTERPAAAGGYVGKAKTKIDELLKQWVPERLALDEPGYEQIAITCGTSDAGGWRLAAEADRQTSNQQWSYQLPDAGTDERLNQFRAHLEFLQQREPKADQAMKAYQPVCQLVGRVNWRRRLACERVCRVIESRGPQCAQQPLNTLLTPGSVATPADVFCQRQAQQWAAEAAAERAQRARAGEKPEPANAANPFRLAESAPQFGLAVFLRVAEDDKQPADVRAEAYANAGRCALQVVNVERVALLARDGIQPDAEKARIRPLYAAVADTVVTPAGRLVGGPPAARWRTELTQAIIDQTTAAKKADEVLADLAKTLEPSLDRGLAVNDWDRNDLRALRLYVQFRSGFSSNFAEVDSKQYQVLLDTASTLARADASVSRTGRYQASIVAAIMAARQYTELGPFSDAIKKGDVSKEAVATLQQIADHFSRAAEFADGRLDAYAWSLRAEFTHYFAEHPNHIPARRVTLYTDALTYNETAQARYDRADRKRTVRATSVKTHGKLAELHTDPDERLRHRQAARVVAREVLDWADKGLMSLDDKGREVLVQYARD